MSHSSKAYKRRMESDPIWYMGHLGTALARAEDTDGRLAILEVRSEPGNEPPPHVHSREEEAFYLLEGEIEFHIGEEVLLAKAGDFVWLPRGVPHWFRMLQPTRLLLFLVPAGMEKYFERFSQKADALIVPPPAIQQGYNPQEFLEAAKDYGIQFLLPVG